MVGQPIDFEDCVYDHVATRMDERDEPKLVLFRTCNCSYSYLVVLSVFLQ